MSVPATRIIRDHESWEPHGYQTRSVQHLLERNAGALFLDPGLGKTSVVLEAFRQLKEKGMVRRMLVIAPLRVCQLVWRQEGRKWTQFRELTFTLLHGDKKGDRLKEQTDIHLINPEGIAWLGQQFFGQSLPYDIVTIDELTKFKNSQAKRSKLLRKKLVQVRRRWGATGSPAPNGYMDLFGQLLILDDGAALGRFFTYFRDQYFERDYNGFDYKLKPDGADRIEQRIAPYVLRMSADDYLKLPKLIQHIIEIELGPVARKQYNEMKKEMVLSLPEGTVTAANSGAVYSKLAQMANGAVYVSDSTYIEIHTAKLDALADLIEELAGQPLLVGYEFQHDLARLQERFPGVPTLTGLSQKKIEVLEAAWNNGEIPIMFAHPASAGHGLNLQGSGAEHVCWFSRPWDLDLYDQFIRRLLRQGTTAKHIINHVLVVKDSIDEIKGTALQDKDVTQQRLLRALNAEIIHDDVVVRDLVAPKFRPLPSNIIIEPKGEKMALKKLGFQGQQSGAAEGGSVVPRGWGAPAGEAEDGQQELAGAGTATAEAPSVRPLGWGAPAGDKGDPKLEQREVINEKIRAPEPEGEEDDDEQPPAASRALEAFGPGVQGLLSGVADATVAAQAVPKGWGAAAGAEVGTDMAKGPDTSAPAAENAEKPIARARRNAKPTADAQQQGSASAANVGASGTVSETPFVRIELAGLPPHAVAAALNAIANAYGT